MSKVLATVCSIALVACAASTPAASDDWEESSDQMVATNASFTVCDLQRSLSPGGEFGALDSTTCGVIEGGPTGTCCSPFHEDCCGSYCGHYKGVTIIAGSGDSANPTMRVDSCSVSKPDQVFSPIWSSSKMVTTAIFMKLVEQGTLDLTAPLSRYLDWWTTDTTDPRARVTLSHTLSMTDGFGQNACGVNIDLDANGETSGGVGSGTEYTQEECARKIYNESYGNIWNIRGEPLVGGQVNGGCTGFSPVNSTASYGGTTAVVPGAFWCYNEAHWTLTAYVAMAVTGKSTYQEVFEEVMASAIGINTTNCHWNWPSVQNVDGGGGLSCSVAEYSKFLGAYVTNSFLSEQSSDEMEKVHAPFPEPYAGFGESFQISGYRYGMFQQWDPSAGTPYAAISDGGNDGFLAWFTRPTTWAVIGRDGDQARHLGADTTAIYGSAALARVSEIIAAGGGDSDSCGDVCNS